MNLREQRIALGISQSKLARISGVSRFKICTYELGDTTLNAADQERIGAALEAEVRRIANIAPLTFDARADESAPQVKVVA